MTEAACTIPATADGEAAAEARRLTAASGTSFYLGMRILPRPRREAMFAIYAFCRVVDDIADGTEPPARRMELLQEWRAEIDRLYRGQPRHLVARALVPAVAKFALRKEDFLAIVDGMEMDAREAMRAPNAATLQLYCDRVAGAVGLLSIRAFGDASPAAERFALALGRALQLTNILRDLAGDAAIGRLYLPRESLLAHGIDQTDPVRVLAHPALPGVCRDVARMARAHFAEADAALRQASRTALRPALIMGGIYRAILDRLERGGWHHPERPVRVPKWVKLWIALRHAAA